MPVPLFGAVTTPATKPTSNNAFRLSNGGATILAALGLDPNVLGAVQLEHTQALPDVPPGL